MNVMTLVFVLCVLAGCASERRSVIEPPAPAPSIGTSVRGKPMAIDRFGDGSARVLILAGIHGDERESVALADRFVRYLREYPQAGAGRSVAIIPVANPDGYLANKRVNANGIDLNRNFPATNFRGSTRFSTRPSDQPETIALMRLIDDFRPSLIISIHSIPAGGECNNFDGPAERIARVMSERNHYRVAPTIGYPTPGSMGSFYGIDRGIPIITLELPRGTREAEVWEMNRDALVAAIAAVD